MPLPVLPFPTEDTGVAGVGEGRVLNLVTCHSDTRSGRLVWATQVGAQWQGGGVAGVRSGNKHHCSDLVTQKYFASPSPAPEPGTQRQGRLVASIQVSVPK